MSINFDIPNVWETPSNSKKSCPKTIRDQLRVKWWKGKYEGPCFCCGRKISYEHVEAGRIKAGGQYSVPDTRLICKICNRGMGKQNLKIYMKRNFPERYKKYFSKGKEKPGKPSKPKPKSPYDPFGIRVKPIRLF
ncbi:hypothetical protein HYY73_02960 [Candidatus Woesearchaeota archaeon]|nr:hypothetical protein [Candidatus Woesearchaeota archaeon]